MNYSKTPMSQKFFYVCPEDLVQYRKDYRKVEVVDDKYVKCFWDFESYDSVDGYIFDGKSWWPAEITWDGWQPIHEEEEEE